MGKTRRCLRRSRFVLLDLTRRPISGRPEGFDEKAFILVNPTSGWRQKSWLPECWAQMLAALRNDTDLEFVMTSASVDWQMSNTAARSRRSPALSCVSLASSTTLKNFLWLCSRAKAVLTVDGAASHLAARVWREQHHPLRTDELSELALCGQREHRRQAPPSKDRRPPLAEILPPRTSSTVTRRDAQLHDRWFSVSCRFFTCLGGSPPYYSSLPH